MIKRLFLGFFAVLTLSFGAQAAEVVATQQREIEIIDTPTADVVDHYGYFVSFRFGKDGGLQTKTAFGVFPRLNIGFGLDGERVIGTEDARLNKPTINVKFRIFDGVGYIPAFALGYDGQGYVFNKATDEYDQREKGFYLAATKEMFIPNLVISFGGNIMEFDEGNSGDAFAGFSYIYERTIGFMFEYDHLTNYDDRRLNFGLKYFVTPAFTVDALIRNIPEFAGAQSRETERVLRLNYTGSF
jgi:hypothetical protein